MELAMTDLLNVYIYLASIQHFVGATQPAGRRCAHLNVVLASGFAVRVMNTIIRLHFHSIKISHHPLWLLSLLPQEHRVESGHLVNTHIGQRQRLGHLVHGRNRKPAMLPLSQVEQRDHGTAFVALRVDAEDGFDALRKTAERTIEIWE